MIRLNQRQAVEYCTAIRTGMFTSNPATPDANPGQIMLMAKGVDGDHDQWTEVNIQDDFDNVLDGDWYDYQLWQEDAR